MKRAIFFSATLFLTGCSSTNITKLVEQLKNDPATVSVHVTTVYGTVSFNRVGTLKPNQSETVSPDGTITIKPQ